MTRAAMAASVITAMGVVIALGASLGPVSTPGSEPGASLIVRLPDPVRMTVLALLVLAAVIVLAMQRPRPRPVDEPPGAHASQRLPPWVTVSVLLALVTILYVVWHRWPGAGADAGDTPFAAISQLLGLLALVRKPPTSVPMFDLAVAALALVVAVAVAGLVVLVAMSDVVERWRSAREAAAAAPVLAPSAVIDGDDLRSEPDARVAVIRAYRRFEHLLSTAHAPRAPWHTPAECMRATIARLPVPLPPVERLTALFEVARFSDRPLPLGARDAACDCLDEIEAALATLVTDAS